ncbi:ComEC/Rec2 family competence protein [Mycoplasma gypis]|nr:ComEC/Rec2 family competence protein [[Mycoplasma] gypis]
MKQNNFKIESFYKHIHVDYILRNYEITNQKGNIFYSFIYRLFSKNSDVAQTFLSFFIYGSAKTQNDVYQSLIYLNIAHFFVVSGFHFGVITFSLIKIFKKMKINDKFGWILALQILFIYLLFLNFSLPALRAFVYFCLNFVFKFVFRKNWSKIHIYCLCTLLFFIINYKLFEQISNILSFSMAFLALLIYESKIKHKFMSINLLCYLLGQIIFSAILKEFNIFGFVFQIVFTPFIGFMYFYSLFFFWAYFLNDSFFNFFFKILFFLKNYSIYLPTLSLGLNYFIYCYLFVLFWIINKNYLKFSNIFLIYKNIRLKKRI